MVRHCLDFGRIDIMVNNARYCGKNYFHKMDERNWTYASTSKAPTN